MTKPCRYCQQTDWGKHSCNRCGGERPQEIRYHGADLLAQYAQAHQASIGWKTIAGSVILNNSPAVVYDEYKSDAYNYMTAHMNRGMR